MRIIFLGNSDFSATILTKLLNENINVVAVVTVHDKKGNRNEIVVSEVKKLATKASLFCLETEKVCTPENLQILKDLKPDLFITASFGQMLTDNFLSIAKTINVHGSLLPKYRGATPIQSAILNGEIKTGITILETIKPLDAGDILLKKEIGILPNENSEELFLRMADLGQEAIIEAIEMIENHTAKFEKQDESEVTYCKTFSKNDAKIAFDLTATQINNQVRGFNPWPVAYTFYQGKMLKIYKSQVVENAEILNLFVEKITGSVVSTKRNIYVLCGQITVLEILELQFEGGKRLETKVFLNGKSLVGGFDYDV